MGGRIEKKHIDEGSAFPQPANDARPVFERLEDYVTRGIEAPESLSLAEIRQISFALSLYLSPGFESFLERGDE